MFSKLRMPHISHLALPENEREAAACLNSALIGLLLTATDFRAALLLYHEAKDLGRARDASIESNILLGRWPFLGARVGALCLYDFWMATQAINSDLLYRIPSINDYIDREAKKRAQSKFIQAFPDFAALRTAAAHPQEINATPEKKARNFSKSNLLPDNFLGDDDVDISIVGSIVNGRYMSTLNGKVLSCNLDASSADILGEVVEEWAKTFAPSAEFTSVLLNSSSTR